jgi:tRNA (guanosine-2'-O-)-methyltransferase
MSTNNFSPNDVISKISPFLTESRKEKIEKVIERRTNQYTIVLENIHDFGNIHAVWRTCENFGVQSVHMINSEKTKKTSRVTQGADKWLSLSTYPTIEDCCKSLKKQGYQILATCLNSESIPLPQVERGQKLALIFGNEKDGVSQKALELADQNFSIPTVGLSQSFNISVAAAITLQYLFQDGFNKTGLSSQEKLELKALFYKRSFPQHPPLFKDLAP